MILFRNKILFFITPLCFVCFLISSAYALPDYEVSHEHAQGIAKQNSLANLDSFWIWEIKNIVSRLHPDIIFEKSSLESCNLDSQPYLDILRYVPSRNFFNSADHVLYQISILFQSAPNTFALSRDSNPEGVAQIFISTGLLGLLRSEDELAFIIAHEESHIALDHFSPDISFMVLTTSQISHIMKIKQRWEYEADARAIKVMGNGNFKKVDSISLLKRLTSLDLAEQTPFSIHHPPSENRITKIRVYLSNNMAMLSK